MPQTMPEMLITKPDPSKSSPKKIKVFEVLRSTPATPPEGVREEARKGLEWRKKYNRGGTLVGVARARTLANGQKVPFSTLKRMKAYFDRHESDKQGEGWSPGENGFPSAGRIAWALWGGDAGRTWAEKEIRMREGNK